MGGGDSEGGGDGGVSATALNSGHRNVLVIEPAFLFSCLSRWLPPTMTGKREDTLHCALPHLPPHLLFFSCRSRCSGHLSWMETPTAYCMLTPPPYHTTFNRRAETRSFFCCSKLPLWSVTTCSVPIGLLVCSYTSSDYFIKIFFKDVSREFDEFGVNTHLCKLRCWYL